MGGVALFSQQMAKSPVIPPFFQFSKRQLPRFTFPDVIRTLSPTVSTPLVDTILAFNPVKTRTLTQSRSHKQRRWFCFIWFAQTFLANSNSGHAHFYASDSEFPCSSCLYLRNLKTCSSSFDPNAFMWASKSACVSNSHEQHGHFFISTPSIKLPFF